jgi:hypothetical protein
MTDQVKCFDLTYPDSLFKGPLVYGSPTWRKQFPPAREGEGNDYEVVSCPEFPDHRRTGLRRGPLKIVLPRRTSDFTWTWQSDCIITERVAALFSTAGLTGFDVQPIVFDTSVGPTLSGADGHRLLELVALGATVAAPESGIREVYHCRHCELRVYSSYRKGIQVRQDDWDGSDFFTVRGYPKIRLVTERVKKVIVENRLTNCVLIRADEMIWSKYLSKPEDTYALG